ncbi:hypothetical protein [Lysobacter gummosus]
MGALQSRMSPLAGDRARGPKAAQGPTLLESRALSSLLQAQ